MIKYLREGVKKAKITCLKLGLLSHVYFASFIATLALCYSYASLLSLL